MRARQIYENILTELNKRKAPSLLLEDYNYFINKGINQFVNKTYNIYEVNEQASDNLRVLKSSIILTPSLATGWSGSNLLSNSYEVNLPDDYLHITGCIVEFQAKVAYKCWAIGDTVQYLANRGTSDNQVGTVNNYYFKPSVKKPYYYINNITTSAVYPTTDNIQSINNTDIVADNRYGNTSKVRMEIRYGKDSSKFEVKKLYVDYLRVPKLIEITQDQIDEVTDNSQILEFPDYVCQEIINETVALVMENASDPRLRTNIPVSQSIASPGQEQKR